MATSNAPKTRYGLSETPAKLSFRSGGASRSGSFSRPGRRGRATSEPPVPERLTQIVLRIKYVVKGRIGDVDKGPVGEFCRLGSRRGVFLRAMEDESDVLRRAVAGTQT